MSGSEAAALLCPHRRPDFSTTSGLRQAPRRSRFVTACYKALLDTSASMCVASTTGGCATPPNPDTTKSCIGGPVSAFRRIDIYTLLRAPFRPILTRRLSMCYTCPLNHGVSTMFYILAAAVIAALIAALVAYLFGAPSWLVASMFSAVFILACAFGVFTYFIRNPPIG